MSPSKILTTLLRRSFATEATLKTNPYVLHRLEQPPLHEVALKRDEGLRFYEQMATIRRLETVLNQLYQAKVVRGFCHLYSGQEAIAVGAFAAFRPQDTMITTYRCHGWGFLFHGSVDPVIAELVGVKSGSVKGKGGSMHIYTKNFYGGNGIVGAHVPLGVGLALAHKYKNLDAVSVVCYGDGASHNAQVYESYNMSKLWGLPCLFLIENNVYAMGTTVIRATKNPDLFTKGDPVPGMRVDGMDVLSVKEAVRYSIEHIRSGKGPIILEALTYRYSGHSLSDPGTSYRTKDEVQQVRSTRDPITAFKNKLIEAALATEEDFAAIDKKIKTVVDEGSKKAQADKPLEVQELTHDIYASEVIKEVRGVHNHSIWPHKTSGEAWNLK